MHRENHDVWRWKWIDTMNDCFVIYSPATHYGCAKGTTIAPIARMSSKRNRKVWHVSALNRRSNKINLNKILFQQAFQIVKWRNIGVKSCCLDSEVRHNEWLLRRFFPLHTLGLTVSPFILPLLDQGSEGVSEPRRLTREKCLDKGKEQAKQNEKEDVREQFTPILSLRCGWEYGHSSELSQNSDRSELQRKSVSNNSALVWQ